ncbi:SCO3374 family protein [Streptomyces sp. NBRC 110035]|uniref:SCO3374 family protein n=1 Tax=Streptomyces sp. NBRC 110035 TaxID=1547867 RepID=UPI000ADFB30B|nr:SCO3374 family protein [Streptomyces sp. NBRC 110035]
MTDTAPSALPATSDPSAPAHRSATTAEKAQGRPRPTGPRDPARTNETGGPGDPSDPGSPSGPGSPGGPSDPGDPVRRWYEDEQGWPTLPGSPVRLPVGVRFDILDVPAEAGRAALERLELPGPVALQGGRMRLLVAAGSAEELPGLLAWLEWGTLALDLAAVGAGGFIDAPSPPGPVGHGAVRPLPPDHPGPQGAAVWLRPPEPGREVEASLPTLSATGGRAGAPDLVRLVNTVATQCHRIRLLRARARPPAGVREAGRTDSQPLACS